METETEAGSSDMSECPHDDKPTTGIIIFNTRTTAAVILTDSIFWQGMGVVNWKYSG